MSGQVLLERQAQVAWVTLSHRGKFNAMSRPMWRQLKQVFGALQQDRSVRCVVLRGEGGNFCAGGDISEYPAFRFEEAGLRDFHENDVWGGLQAILDCDVPIVAQIEGNCMGAGVELASCCDIRIADPEARFGAPIARLGFPMAPRELALVAQQLGAVVARSMLLEAAVFNAPELLARGFLTRLSEAGLAHVQAQAAAQRIAQLAPQAARLNKQTIRSLGLVQTSSIAPEAIANAYDYAASLEHREGVMAFMEKRIPHFPD